MLRTLAITLVLTGAVFVAPGSAHEFKVGDLLVDHPWARPNLPNRPTAAYATIANQGAASDRLISAFSPSFGKAEFHNSVHEDGIMKMQMVEGIEIPPQGEATLAPGGYHIMLFDGGRQFEVGESFALELIFESAGTLEVTVKVKKWNRGTDHGTMGHGGTN
ncbi:MAG: copper chaperone PCu(A)C [Pseudomonadota bacterium]